MSDPSSRQRLSLTLSLEQGIDAACRDFEQAWQAGQRPAIEPYLADAPPEARATLLRELLALELAYRRLAGESASAEEYRRRFPEHSTVLDQVLTADEAVPAGGSRYRPVRPHARGGLGEVEVAEDLELGREVALKRIRAGHVHDPESRRRFLREAEITGRLEHPGIVPIYGLVQDAAGHPCYAMRLIEGQTLQDAIRQFHAADRSGHEAPGQRLALRELLGHFIAVCNTMAYAHCKGVIHRDLKPRNVMLGQFGETLVVDWGLARPFRGDDESRADPDTAVGADDPDGLGTRQGTVAGTPAYMSPEQAAGDWDRVGPASDVYSLGATLYEILVGRPPIEAETLSEMLGRVRRGEWAPPRQVRPAVPRALEAICRKAMAAAPADRYTTATELAADVARWLADEPVTAWREPVAVRVRRWGRRYRALVAAAAALLLTAVVALAISTALVGRALRQEERARRDRALAQVDTLLHASPQAVPEIIAGLQPHRDDVLPRLLEVWAEEAPDNRQRRLRAGLALLRWRSADVERRLFAGMLEAETPQELLLIRDALRRHGADLGPALWKEADRPTATPAQRFRALVALAAFDSANPRWQQAGRLAVEQLLTADPLHLGPWVEALRPVRAALLTPLGKAFRSHPHVDDRRVAATVLADYAADRPEVLADLVMDADERQYALLLPRLLMYRRQAVALMNQELDREAAANASEQQKDVLARRQAQAAATLLHLGRPGRVWPLLAHDRDPRVRSFLIHRLAPLGIDPRLVVGRLAQETEVTTRRALLLGLGEFDEDRLAAIDRPALVAALLRDYRDDVDPGIHSAVDWLLRRWGQAAALRQIDRELISADQKARGERRWYVNGRGDTLVIIPGPVTFLMGSPASEPDRRDDEARHRRRIPRSFAVATREVTVRQFVEFRKANPDVRHSHNRRYSPDDDGPIISVTWFHAAQYCNWLSKVEGIPQDEWCYPEHTAIEEGMKPVPGYLSKRGYRLPTEAEWEYACRAGATTTRFYGEGVELLAQYGWYFQNAGERTQPVGRLKPNDFGLFDVYGNVSEWTNDRWWPHFSLARGHVIDDVEDEQIVRDGSVRVLRGGTFSIHPSFVRSAHRGRYRPMTRLYNVGFRVARTYP